MTIGSLVHELFQTVINRKLTKFEEIKAVADEMLNSAELTFTLYAAVMGRDETKIELYKFLPKILQFIEQYITGDNVKVFIII